MKLNLPSYPFKIKSVGAKKQIFDEIRKKYIALTPEEWVRQHFLMYMVNQLGYVKSLMAVEKEIKYLERKKRFDALVFDSNGKPLMIVECKAPNIKLTQDVLFQIAQYNFVVQVDHLVITNGLQHFAYKIDHENKKLLASESIPNFDALMRTGD